MHVWGGSWIALLNCVPECVLCVVLITRNLRAKAVATHAEEQARQKLQAVRHVMIDTPPGTRVKACATCYETSTPLCPCTHKKLQLVRHVTIRVAPCTPVLIHPLYVYTLHSLYTLWPDRRDSECARDIRL